MEVERDGGDAVATLGAAIGDPARSRILFCLMGGRARTSTELALVAQVSPSTASEHLNRLKAARLVKVLVQGKHRYYSLQSADVARLVEQLSVFANGTSDVFLPNTPKHLRAARTCYDHIAGTLGVDLHDRMSSLGWLDVKSGAEADAYDLTPKGSRAMSALGIDIDAVRATRRRFMFGCLDWSERRAHVGGAIGAALLAHALKRRWVVQDRDGRALRITALGGRDMMREFGVRA